MPNRKSKSPKKFGFDVVPGGFVQPPRRKQPLPQDDPRNAWDRKHLPVDEDLQPEHFTIWLAATDVGGHTSETGASVCAWRIRGETTDKIEVWLSDAPESSEKKAYVAAAAGALDRLPKSSTAEIICRETYIVDAINGRVIAWFPKLHPLPDERYPRQPYGLVWYHFLQARERITSIRMTAKQTDIAARRPRARKDEDDRIIEELKQKARAARPSG